MATAAALHGGEMASVNEIEKAQNNEKNINEIKKDLPKDKEDPPKEEEKTTEKDQEQWQKITENYLKNIDELKSQSMCLHWFNRNKDVLKNMKVVVPRMYGEIQEHYERKLESLKL